MEFFTTFKICASGLSAQRAKLDVITSNIANVNTTSTPEGGPYKRKMITFSAEPLKEGFDKTIKIGIIYRLNALFGILEQASVRQARIELSEEATDFKL